jgi:hypothetical protein
MLPHERDEGHSVKEIHESRLPWLAGRQIGRFCRLELLLTVAILASMVSLFWGDTSSRRTIILSEQSFTKEGIGSILFAQRHALIIAEALNAQLRMPDRASAHGYSVAEVLGLRVSEQPLKRACLQWQRVTSSEITRMATLLCDAKARPEVVKQLESLFQGCFTIVLDMAHPGYTGLAGNDKCSRNWVRTNMRPLFKRSAPDPGLLQVGIHLRMGDLEDKADYFKLFNTTKLSNVVAGLRKCCARIVFRVATQVQNKSRVSAIVGGAEVLNGGSVTQPMEWLASSRVLFVSGGTYGLLLAQVLDPEVLVVQPSHEVSYSGWDDKLSLQDHSDGHVTAEICDRYKVLCAGTN